MELLTIELLLSNNTRTSEERVEHDVAWDKSGPGCGPNLCMCVCLDSKITCTLKASHNCGNIRHLVKWTETKKPKILERNLNCSYIGWLNIRCGKNPFCGNKTKTSCKHNLLLIELNRTLWCIIQLTEVKDRDGKLTVCLFSGKISDDQNSRVIVRGCQADQNVSVTMASKLLQRTNDKDIVDILLNPHHQPNYHYELFISEAELEKSGNLGTRFLAHFRPKFGK